MSSPGCRVARRAAVVCLALANVLRSSGQENIVRPGEGGVPAERDGVAEAKQDFDMMKSSRDAPQGRREAPRVGLPEWQPPPAPAGARPLPRPSAGPTKSTNWLLEAMDREAKSRQAERGGDQSRGDRDEAALLSRERDPTGKASGEKQPAPRTPGQVPSPGSTSVVANPLAGYLEQWMTPQDYALLRPGLVDSLDSAAGPRVSPVPGGRDGAGSPEWVGAADLRSALHSGERPPLMPRVPQVNPYLASIPTSEFSSPAAAPTPVASSVGPTPVTSPAALGPPPRPAPETRIPEFARPATDEKYFKPLKRF